MAVDLPGLGRTPKVRYENGCNLNQLEVVADQIEKIRVEHGIAKWHVVGHDAGSAIAVHYAHRFQEHVDHLALLSPAVFPELKPFHLFRVMRRPVVGELLAPVVNAIFWKIAMRCATEPQREELNDVVEDFHAPFSGPLGAWRLMSVLRFGDPPRF
jgi:pimeloyl-ACP methyl ester carboxylesterase